MADDNFELELIEEQAVAHIQAMVLRLLDEKEMSRTDLANAMNVSAAHVSQLLGDEPQNLSIKKAARLFFGLGETLQMTCETIERMNREAVARNAQSAALCEEDNAFSWLSASVSNDVPGQRCREARDLVAA